MKNERTFHGDSNPYNILTDPEVRKIQAAVFQLMEEIGIKFDADPRAMKLFSQAGCSISSEGIVRFPTDLVEKSLTTTAKSVKVWDRSEDSYIEYNNQNTIMMAGNTCTEIVDYKTGKARPGSSDDLATIVRLADGLSNIDAVGVPIKLVNELNIAGQVKELLTVAVNTGKPFMYVSEDVEPLAAAIELGSIMRGGAEQLREQPYFSHLISPLPLNFTKNHIEQIFLCAENAIPIMSTSMGIGGASSPITIAGNVVHCLATDFACIVLSQLIQEGSFCACCTVPAFINPADGLLGGLPETSLAELARCQILREMDLPLGGSGAGIGGGGNYLDGHNIAVAALLMMSACFSRPGLSFGLGSINLMNTFSLHALIYCNELVGWIRRMWKGIEVNEDTLALDVTRAMAPGAGYMAEMHTAIHCRTELWRPDCLFTFGMADSSGDNAPDQMIQLLDERLNDVLSNHQPQPLTPSVAKKISGLQHKYGAT